MKRPGVRGAREQRYDWAPKNLTILLTRAYEIRLSDKGNEKSETTCAKTDVKALSEDWITEEREN